MLLGYDFVLTKDDNNIYYEAFVNDDKGVRKYSYYAIHSESKIIPNYKMLEN